MRFFDFLLQDKNKSEANDILQCVKCLKSRVTTNNESTKFILFHNRKFHPVQCPWLCGSSFESLLDYMKHNCKEHQKFRYNITIN